MWKGQSVKDAIEGVSADVSFYAEDFREITTFSISFSKYEMTFVLSTQPQQMEFCSFLVYLFSKGGGGGGGG